MDLQRIAQATACLLAACSLTLAAPANCRAQDDAPQPVVQKIHAANTKLELTVNSSRILSMDKAIPKAQVANPELLDFTVLSENQVQVHAKKPGITSINLWDETDEIHTVDVIVSGDVRELDRLLRTQFPTAAVKLFPTSASTLILFGYVDRPDYVNRIMRISEDYYPKVINNMTVGGAQQVLLHVKVMEVSRTKLRDLGFDFMNFSSDGFFGSGAANIITKANPTTSVFRTAAGMTTTGRETFSFGFVNDPNGFVGFLEALKQNDVLKVLAEPDLVAVSGRPATYLVGGEVPYPKPTGFGNISIDFRAFGTQIDFVPIVLGNGGVRLEVRPSVSEIDPTLSVSVAGTSVPGFRRREVETGVEMKFGQTLAIAGLLQQRTQAQTRGIPYLMDVPFVGAAFRRTHNQINEVELLIMVRPELVEALDADQVPACGPGMNTMSPDDCDLFWKGYTEVPIRNGNGCMAPGAVQGMQQVPPGAPGIPPGVEEMPSSMRGGMQRGSVVVSDVPAGNHGGQTPVRRLPNGTTDTSASRGPYNPASTQQGRPRTAANPASAQPGFLGPRGYDVRN